MYCEENAATPVPANLQDAQKQTDNWRKYFAMCYNLLKPNNPSGPITSEGDNVYRGFRIPLSDLCGIMNVIETYNKDDKNTEKIHSVRIYLASKNKTPEDTVSNDMHVYLVPIKGGNEMNDAASSSDYGSDLVLYQGKSTVFDFSNPCPKQCDTGSSLYRLANITAEKE